MLINDKVMVKIVNIRLLLNEYHCGYSPCSSNKLFKFWTTQTILSWNEDAKADFISLKNVWGTCYSHISK